MESCCFGGWVELFRVIEGVEVVAVAVGDEDVADGLGVEDFFLEVLAAVSAGVYDGEVSVGGRQEPGEVIVEAAFADTFYHDESSLQ